MNKQILTIFVSMMFAFASSIANAGSFNVGATGILAKVEASGTETENGIQITYGANWEVTGRKVNVFSNGVLNEGFSIVNADELAELPPILVAPAPGSLQIIEVINNDQTKITSKQKGQ